MVNYYWVIAGVLGGIILGIFIGVCIYNTLNTFGVLRIDHTNPNKDIYRIDINEFDDLSKKKRIILQIDNNANISQK